MSQDLKLDMTMQSDLMDEDLCSNDQENPLDAERLAGQCKTKYAMNFKLQTEKIIEDRMRVSKLLSLVLMMNLQTKTPSKGRNVTKGRFQVAIPNQVSTFRLDRGWKKKANPDAWKVEEYREMREFHHIKNKHDQKKLQYMALEQKYPDLRVRENTIDAS